MIVVDTHILAWGGQNERDPHCPDGVERAIQLFSDQHTKKQTIVVPVIALAEYLSGQKSERCRSIQDIVGRAFFIAPFNTQAADIAAQLYNKRISDAIRQGNSVTRDALKDDYKILATAICQGATHLYTHDPWIAKIEQHGIAKRTVKVVQLPSLRPQACVFLTMTKLKPYL